MRYIIFSCFIGMMLVSCQIEPYDPAAAQQQMSGRWAYVEENSDNACQMQISADGNNGLNISNFACSGLTIKVKLLNATHLNIPRQTVSGDIFEGSGTIKKYQTIELRFTYDNGREKLTIAANCTKL